MLFIYLFVCLKGGEIKGIVSMGSLQNVRQGVGGGKINNKGA